MVGANQSSPCPHCRGTGSVVVKGQTGADGKKAPDTVGTCPVCKGTRRSDGLIRK